MLPNDLSLTVSQRKLACVLDPALALGYAHGPTVAVRLTRVLETWLTRSFWQVLDASDLLDSLLAEESAHAAKVHIPIDPLALSAWITMRDSTDAGSWCLRWMGDCVAESQVQDGNAPDLVERYEALAGALGARDNQWTTHAATWADGLDPVMTSFDAVALSATLDGAPVLSFVTQSDATRPWPVQALERANVRTTSLEPMPQETLFAAERKLLRNALVTAGLASIATTLPRLAVVHVLVGAEASAPHADDTRAAPGPWDSAHAWWYLI
jgi:hypothetical protein